MTREERRKMLAEMLNENDFDIDSFIDYKPNFIKMKKIKFDPVLIGKPGIVCKVDGEVPDFIKWYNPHSSLVRYVLEDGKSLCVEPSHPCLSMYRQIRSAEDIAKEVYADFAVNNGGFGQWTVWDRLPDISKALNVSLIQAGLNENKEEEI